jgi:hypothetical protein
MLYREAKMERALLTTMDNLLIWCRIERASLQRQLDLMVAGTIRIGEHQPGQPPRDTTPTSIEDTRRKIAELDDILARPNA